MTSALKSPVRPACVRTALCAVFLVALSSLAVPPPAPAQEPRFEALVFSRTTGFRHTAAINAGRTALTQMGTAQGFGVTLSEDAGEFTSHNLRNYDVIVFLNTDGEGILNAAQRTAFERWMQRGGGAVSIHADANADKAWDWKRDMMGGGLFNNHPPIQQATVDVVDPDHPATEGLPAEFQWTDEWYNFDADPREDVHVLMTVDETTYTGGQHGAGHPIAWCTNYDGGRHFYTGLGHADGGATLAWENATYLTHISGALDWAAGEEEGDCGAPRPGLPTDASLTKVTLDDETANPMSLTVAPDGRVFFVQMGSTMSTSGPAQVKLYDPEADATTVIATLNVSRRNENGLMGIALDPEFAENGFVYLYYSLPGGTFTDMGTQRLARFTFNESTGMLDMSSEVRVLEIPHQRLVCCHAAGSLQFGPDGLLYLSTGDDTEHSQSNGYSPHDSRQCGPGSWDAGDADCNEDPVTGQAAPWPTDALHANDARRTSGNTNDLRGKIIRIDPIAAADPTDAPGIGSTYDIPAGNLFPVGTEGTRAEIYTMGHRNPFRFGFDPETGWIYQGEVGPDSNTDNLQPPPSAPPPNNEGRGPRGYDEINQIRSAGNYGWPYCIGNNFAYRPWAFTGGTGAAGGPQGGENAPYFDCAGGPTNNSPVNTGLTQVPGARPAWIYYPYGASPQFPDIPPAGTRAAVGGPVYRFDPELDSDYKLSEWFDGKLIWGDWTRNLMMATGVGESGDYAGTTRLAPNTAFAHPHDIELGPDGAVYMIEWGNNFNYGSYGINADSGIYRIEQRPGGLPALANAQASPTFGSAPLEVQFTGELSDRGADDAPAYEWDFGDGTTSTEVNPSHTYTEAGTYEITLTVTDEAGETTDTVSVNVTDSCPGGIPQRSDEFDGDALDRDRWEVVREDATHLSVADGSLNLTTTSADIFGGTTGMQNIVLQDIPNTGGPWSFTTEMTWNPTENFHNAGLLIYEDDNNWIKFGMVWSGSRQFELWKELGGTPAESAFSGALPAAFPGTYFMRYLSESGDDVVAQYSADGEQWTTLATRDLSGLDNPRIGLYGTASNDSDLEPIANFHSVAVEPEQFECPETCGRSDEFDEGSLNTQRWTARVEPPGVPSIEDGQLVLPIQNEIDGTSTGPLSFVSQQVPDGDWTLTTRVTPTLESSWAQAGLMLWQSDGNFVKTVFGRDSNSGVRRFEITSDNPTDTRQIGPNVTVDETFPGTAWIRMIKEGNTIRAEFAPDVAGEPGTWQAFGGTRPVDVSPPREGPGVQVGLYAGSDVLGPPFNQTAAFDFARFEPDEGDECPEPGDTTPPVTTHELEGTGPVDVTLSATDPGEGGGEPQTHDVQADGATWDPDELDLTAGDVVTWHFDDPPAQFPHDVWLVPPGGDPAPNGGDIFEVTDGTVPAGGPPVSHTLQEAGTWTYICRLHSAFTGGQWAGMVGTAEVAPGEGPSGVDFTEYRINTDGETGDWVRSDNDAGDDPFETSFTVADEGEHEVEYRSTDNAGNAEEIKSVEFEIEGEPPAEYCPRSDEFDGTSLNRDRWTVIREDPTRLSVADGALNLNAPPLDIFTGQTGLPNIVLQPLPGGGDEPWSITTEMTWDPNTNFQNAGLIVYGDDDNYVKTGMVWNGARNFELIKELNGSATFPGGAPAGTTPTRYFMRLVSSDGNAVMAQFSANGENWTNIGTAGTNLNGIDDPMIGVYATASTAAGAVDRTANFHSVTITPECDPGEPGAPIVRGFADPSSGAAPLLVRFSSTAIDPDGGPVSYRWSVEGVGTVLGQNFEHTFQQAGEYTATVTATDDEGDTASDEVTVTVGGAANQPPVVDASSDRTSGAAPLAVQFHALGNDPDGPEDELLYTWDFGDGEASFEQDPQHTYMEPGEYTATVTVEDAGGAVGTDTVEITVDDPPGNRPPSVEAAVLPGSGPAPLGVLLTAHGTDPDGDSLSYSWDFGDGSASGSGRSVRHTYGEAGTYTATVTASDGRGGTATAAVEVVVGDPPANQAPTVQAAADPRSGRAPLTVRFSSMARDPDGDQLMYVWEFGDGGEAGGRTATHTYPAPGTYTAMVTVTDPDGATGTGTVQVTVAAAAATLGAPPSLAAPFAPLPAVEGETRASLRRPSSLASFRRRGVRVTVECAATALGRARLMVSSAAAERLRLGRRTVASRRVRCQAGEEVTLRLKPSRRVARRLAAARRVRLTLRVTVEGAGTAQRRLTLRR